MRKKLAHEDSVLVLKVGIAWKANLFVTMR